MPNLITPQNETNNNSYGICFDHLRSDVRRSRSQDHIFINKICFLETHMHLVRLLGSTHGSIYRNCS